MKGTKKNNWTKQLCKTLARLLTVHSLLYAPKTIHVPYASRGGMGGGRATRSARLMQVKVLFFMKDLCETAALITWLLSVKTAIMVGTVW